MSVRHGDDEQVAYPWAE